PDPIAIRSWSCRSSTDERNSEFNRSERRRLEMADTTQPITPGMRAPDFSLPAVDREGTVSLASYRGQHPLLLAVFRGLWCPFCRRPSADLGAVTAKLHALGVETLAVVATAVDNARLYFKHRPTKVPLAADPDCTVHRAYGVPKAPMNAETMAAL